MKTKPRWRSIGEKIWYEWQREKEKRPSWSEFKLAAEEYLEKARTMFEEMDLQWDLDELDKIVNQ